MREGGGADAGPDQLPTTTPSATVIVGRTTIPVMCRLSATREAAEMTGDIDATSPQLALRGRPQLLCCLAIDQARPRSSAAAPPRTPYLQALRGAGITLPRSEDGKKAAQQRHGSHGP